MKYFLFTVFYIFLNSMNYGQTGIYTWIGKTDAELIEEKGQPVSTLNRDSSTIYIYQTEIGYQSFFAKDKIIFKINTTTYWKTMAREQSALKLIQKMYNDDGFKIIRIKKDKYLIKNDLYKVEVSTYISDKVWHSVSETITKL